MTTALIILVALVAGAAWRRWFGSRRPLLVENRLDPWWRARFGIVRKDKGAPWRAAQVVLGIAGLALLNRWAGDLWWRCAVDAAVAIGIMTLPIHISRRPFELLMEKINPPKMWGTMLNGAAPWGEALQGAVLCGVAVLV